MTNPLSATHARLYAVPDPRMRRPEAPDFPDGAPTGPSQPAETGRPLLRLVPDGLEES